MTNIQTKRLLLREWKKQDLDPFAKLNADPRVMEYFPKLQTREESELFIQSVSDHLSKHGWGLWAVSLLTTEEFIGFIGLNNVGFKAPFNEQAPAIEIGWRLAFDYWGKGYATEGAQAALEFGFHTLHLEEIVSFTALQNSRSRKVMEKIGMHRNPEDDFDHPKLPKGHRLRKHCLYRITAKEWETIQGSNI